LVGVEALKRLFSLVGVEALKRLFSLVGVEAVKRLFSLVGVEALKRLVNVDLAAGDLLHQLNPVGRGRGGGAVDADFREQRVESSSRRWVADAEVPLELLHVPARREEDPKHVAVLVRQNAELARGEAP
jgi:hypothetical protein